METHLTPERTARLLAAVARPLRVRREVINLAAHASGHLCGPRKHCRTCGKGWPCPDVMSAARVVLDAVADLR